MFCQLLFQIYWGQIVTVEAEGVYFSNIPYFFVLSLQRFLSLLVLQFWTTCRVHEYTYLNHLATKCHLASSNLRGCDGSVKSSPHSDEQNKSRMPYFYAPAGNLDIDTPLVAKSLEASRIFCGLVPLSHCTSAPSLHMMTYLPFKQRSLTFLRLILEQIMITGQRCWQWIVWWQLMIRLPRRNQILHACRTLLF